MQLWSVCACVCEALVRVVISIFGSCCIPEPSLERPLIAGWTMTIFLSFLAECESVTMCARARGHPETEKEKWSGASGRRNPEGAAPNERPRPH